MGRCTRSHPATDVRRSHSRPSTRITHEEETGPLRDETIRRNTASRFASALAAATVDRIDSNVANRRCASHTQAMAW